MIKKATMKLIENAGWILSVYSIYKQIQTANQAKNEFYEFLEPSQQARWDAIFGKPKITPVNPAALVPPTLTQVQAGT